MTFKEWCQARAMIRNVALMEGVSPAFVRKSIQKTIDNAWSATDPAARAEQQSRFPAGKPTVEAFLIKMTQDLRAEINQPAILE